VYGFVVVWGNNWTLALRCYNCEEAFVVEELAFDKLAGLSLVLPCPACGARPFITAAGGPERSRTHKLLELSDERSSSGVRVLLRLKSDWFYRLGARAHRGSQAEWCLRNALRRPSGEYLIECDDGELAALAALADAAECPDAIRAMREVYLAAIGGPMKHSPSQ
jgi:hypothetical protein